MKKYIFLFFAIQFFTAGIKAQVTNNYTYIYDELNRLLEVQYGNGTTIQYAYDKVGNRTLRVVNPVNPAQPDITPTTGNLSLTTIGPGADINLTYHNENIGTASTGGFNTLIVLSDNSTYEAGTDEILINFYTSNLFAGAMPLVSQLLTIPLTAGTGQKNIIVIADYDNEVDNELSETNNELIIPISIADCAALSLSVNPVDETCGARNGQASAIASGGSSPYTFSWNSNPPQSGSTATGLASGNYEVTLTDQSACETSQNFVINNIGNDPVANFTFTLSGLEVHFFSSAVFADTYVWTFGDGNGSALENPIYNYATAGTFLACLEVTNSCSTDQYCQSVNVNPLICAIPDGLSVTSISEMAAILGWNNSSGALSYNIRYRETGAPNWNPVINTLSATYSLTTLTANTSYEYQVETICSSGNSGYSASYYFSTSTTGTGPGQNFFKEYTPGLNISQVDGAINSLDESYFAGINSGDLYLLKVDVAGDVLWFKKIANGTLSRIDHILATNDNGVIITGTDLDQSFIYKLAADGTVDWQKSISTDTYDLRIHRLAQMNDGQFIGVGWIERINPVASVTQYSLVLKLDTSGNLVWKTGMYPGNLRSFRLLDVVIDSGNNIIVAGDQFGNGTEKIVFFKYNSAGDFLYNGSIRRGATYDLSDPKISLIEVSPDPDGISGLYVRYNSTYNLSNLRTKVAKLNLTDFTLVWSIGYGEQISGSIFTDASDGSILFSLDKEICKLNNAGDVLWSKEFDPTLGISNYQFATNGTKLLFPAYKSNAFDLVLSDMDAGNDCVFQASSITGLTRLPYDGDGSYPIENDLIVNVGALPDVLSTENINSVLVCSSCNIVAGIISSETQICQNQTINLFSTSTGATTYSWTIGIDGVPFSTNANTTFTFNTPGVYTVYLTAANGSNCEAMATVDITVNALPNFFVNTFDEQCGNANGTAVVDVSAVNNPQILWSTGETSTFINGLTAGNYSIAVTNGDGCVTNQNFTIQNSGDGFTLSAQVSHVSCYGQADGMVNLTTNGATGTLTYNWSNGSNANPLTGLLPGDYQVTATDAAGCAAIATYSIMEPPVMTVDFLIQHESAVGATDASATALVAGGTAPYSYIWNNGSNTATTLGLSEGISWVSITDANNCMLVAEASVFVAIENAPGVQLYKKDFSGGNPDYVQIVDLSAGAYLEFDNGPIASGAGTANPTFTREAIGDVWVEKTGLYNNVFSINNGQFFNAGLSPAPLAFPVKEATAMVSEGYANTSEFVGEKLFLPIWNDSANVIAYNDIPASVANASAAQGIVGLHRNADKSPATSTGRTFAGVLDENGDGIYEKVLIFTSKNATQAQAASRLHDFGVAYDQILMLDGGGSTQMRCEGTDYVTAGRLIPQFMVVYAAPQPECVALTAPLNGATGVAVDADLTWSADPRATGYRLKVGTSSGGSDILNNVNVGNVTTYDPGTLPSNAAIYVSISPYTEYGELQSCMEESFFTGASCADLIVENIMITSYTTGSIYYTFDISNIGNQSIDLQGAICQAYLSQDTQLNAGDPGAGGFLFPNSLVLQPNQSVSRSFQAGGSNFNLDLCSTPYLLIQIDNGNVLAECLENNNTGVKTIDDSQVCGCTDMAAHNFDPNATLDNGTCETCSDGILNGDETEIDCGGTVCLPCNVPCLLEELRSISHSTGASIGIAGNDTIFYLVKYVQNKVVALDTNGVELFSFGTTGTGDGQFSFNSPQGIEIAANGDLYIADDGNDRIQVFDALGTYKNQFTHATLNGPRGIHLSDSKLYVSSRYSRMLTVFDLNGNYLSSFSTSGTQNPQDCFVFDNKIFITEGITSIRKYDLNGNFIAEFGAGLNYPFDIEILDAENVLVIDPNQNQVQVYDTAGTFKYFITSSGSALSQHHGILYVAADNAIKEYSLCGEIPGCMDNLAHNYNYRATIDDGSCETCSDGIQNGDEIAVDCGGTLCPVCSPNLTLSYLDTDSIRFVFSTTYNASISNFKVWSKEEGLISGVLNFYSDYLTFIPTAPFPSGRELMISATGITDANGNIYPNKTWIKTSPIDNPTAPAFDSLFTGITLPATAMDYSYGIDNADFNRDGRNDIVFSYYSAYGNPTNILVYLQNSDGTFATPDSYTNSYSHSGIRGTPDLNNDGYPDLVLSHNVPSRAHVRLNNGDGTFGAPAYYVVTNYSGALNFGDIDNDGDIDIIGVSGNASLGANTISLLKNNGDGTFQNQVTINTGVFASGLKLGDLDEDGDLDIVYTSNDSYNSQKIFRIYENDGVGTFTLVVDEINPDKLVINTITDVNGDGHLDLFFIRPNVKILYGNAVLSSFSLFNNIDLDLEDRRIIPGDLDGDQDVDLLNSYSFNGTDFYSLPFNTILNDDPVYAFQPDTIVLGLRTASNLSDLDRDGDLDLLYVDPDRKIKYLLNQNLPLQATVRVFLEGPYSSTTSLMSDHLRVNGTIPLVEPFSALGFTHVNGGGGENILDSATVLGVTGSDAIIDWIFVELRSKNDPTLAVATRSALLQRDGDVVDIDGFSDLKLAPLPAGDYYVVIRHRNHLGIRTQNAHRLTSTPGLGTLIDFTNPGFATYGIDAQKNLSGTMVLYAGEANGDGQINAVDKNAYWRPQNGQAFNYMISIADFNMDGAVNAVDKNTYWRINNSRIQQLD